MGRGGRAIATPLAEGLAGPLYHREGVPLAEPDLKAITRPRFDFDVDGHYARPDVFQLIVNEQSSA